jgi:hypothetical protein
MRYHPFKDDSLNHRLKFGVHYSVPARMVCGPPGSQAAHTR